MKQERLKILSMVEEGKITVDEATKLLEALKDSSPWLDEYESWEVEDKINRFARNAENFSKEVVGKVGSAYKGVEPKLEKATKTVLEKTAAIIDDISRSINDSLKKMDEEKDKDDCGCGCGCEDQPQNNQDDNEPKPN